MSSSEIDILRYTDAYPLIKERALWLFRMDGDHETEIKQKHYDEAFRQLMKEGKLNGNERT